MADFPKERLHAALPPEHPAHATVDELGLEIEKSEPSSSAIKERVGVLRSIPELEATIANWWDNPVTQRVIDDLVKIGL